MTDQELFTRFKYPNGTMKNKRGITDQATLDQLEFRLVNANALALLQHATQFPKIKEIDQLAVVHRFLFGDLYTWAGELRNYNLAKAGHFFQDFQTFREAAQWINSLLAKANQVDQVPASAYAELLDNINEYHPFREGNGRSTKTFLQIFAIQHHQYINFPRHQDQLVAAFNQAAPIDYRALGRMLGVQDLVE
ncbi:MAG TPA: Fic family protein [Candidatus Limosilactobacillus intestinigallinarum]|jgi:cell filamentation protein|nr:Fic family protein [Candidatus Limosilactobacillus intestinigallinarum]